MCADFRFLEREIRALERAGCEYLHFDIMDGTFVPNFTLGPDIVRAVRAMSSIPCDIHLMVVRPEEHLHLFGLRPGDLVSIHAEACIHLQRTLRLIRNEYGARPMVALNPSTPLSALDYVLDDVDAVLLMTVNPGFAGQGLIPSTLGKIGQLRTRLDADGRQGILIAVDGNVNFENALKMRRLGADIFVAGSSSLFVKDADIEAQARRLRECIA
jgi:ribulose-phosphate 3-epimerase